MIRNLFGAFLALALFVLPSVTFAQNADRWEFRQFQIENDVFYVPYSQPGDRFYTSGLRVNFGKPLLDASDARDATPLWLRPVRRFCAACEISPNFSFGQQIYTPEDLENPAPQPGERPWAAWVYGSLGAAIDTSNRTRHDVEVQFGLTGDSAGGELGQKAYHELASRPDPAGWENQLGPDFGINGYYNFQHIWLAGDGLVGWDFVPSIKAAVGTMTTFAGIGGTVRLGPKIWDFPYSPNRPSPRRGAPQPWSELEVYGFFGWEIRAVAYNYFLEGSLFDTEPITVDAERYVRDFSFGVTARWRRYNLTYSVVHRSEEFERTVGTDSGVHTYGSLSLTVGLP